ncbi:hypothetical protein JAAARDRAFT_189868 [Jaapia argillacea MUCL 33604]|uniref:Rho termination factor N-terminal domain-containing protein n=1 Tax=Jaapia argillacea MUCL 33604 TaxID=933084 RepID=A0A067QGC8_9AGAM|nr:hypothetical protein JAAARDRAFT_189868 [Jaapia argillacea MUCL 33604]
MSTTEGLSKFTVPQLKALCKERRITGYSKLAKGALIQKLTDAQNVRLGTSSSGATLSSGIARSLPPTTATVQQSLPSSAESGVGRGLPGLSAVAPGLEVDARSDFLVGEPSNPTPPLERVPSADPSTSITSEARSTTPLVLTPPLPTSTASNTVDPPSNSNSSAPSQVRESSLPGERLLIGTPQVARTTEKRAKRPSEAVGGDPDAPVKKSKIQSILKGDTVTVGQPAAVNAAPSSLPANNSLSVTSATPAPKRRKKKPAEAKAPSNLAVPPDAPSDSSVTPQNFDNASSSSASEASSILLSAKRSLATSSNITDVEPPPKKRKQLIMPKDQDAGPSAIANTPLTMTSTHVHHVQSVFKVPALPKSSAGSAALTPIGRTSLSTSVSIIPNTRITSENTPPNAEPLAAQGSMSVPIPLEFTLPTLGITPTPTNKPSTAKRFKPLVVANRPLIPTNQSATSTHTALLHSPSRASIPAPLTSPGLTNHDSNSLRFPLPLPLPTLKPITFPPKLSERKRVGRWAVILSGLGDEERRVCVRVCKMFRYAVYLSAHTILTHQFRGPRLSSLTTRYPPNMTNMWPFLLQCRDEMRTSKNVWQQSWLGNAFGVIARGSHDGIDSRGIKDGPIADGLWMIGGKELDIAVRFAITRLWFAISIGSPPPTSLPAPSTLTTSRPNASRGWLQDKITSATEVVPNEIWTICTSSCDTGKEETVYVVGATCEVIGSASPTHQSPQPSPSAAPLRADWASYIASRIDSPPLVPQSLVEPKWTNPLMDKVKWANHEEFDRGISRLWLSRMADIGDAGTAMKEVAERYVLASVVGNSLSGKWMSSTEMEQGFSGKPEAAVISGRSTNFKQQVNLYLPFHHHVESVHFQRSRTAGVSNPISNIPVPLHPSLAVIQTPNREYYLLRDNGMQVGCEEDGVAEVWRNVLGCDFWGVQATIGHIRDT